MEASISAAQYESRTDGVQLARGCHRSALLTRASALSRAPPLSLFLCCVLKYGSRQYRLEPVNRTQFRIARCDKKASSYGMPWLHPPRRSPRSPQGRLD